MRENEKRVLLLMIRVVVTLFLYWLVAGNSAFWNSDYVSPEDITSSSLRVLATLALLYSLRCSK